MIYSPTPDDPQAYVSTVDSADVASGTIAPQSHVQIQYQNETYAAHVFAVHSSEPSRRATIKKLEDALIQQLNQMPPSSGSVAQCPGCRLRQRSLAKATSDVVSASFNEWVLMAL